MQSLETKKPKTLAAMLEKAESRSSAAQAAVFALASDDREKFGDLLARLAAHPAVIAFRAAQESVETIRREAHRRYGPAVTFESGWIAFLATYR